MKIQVLLAVETRHDTSLMEIASKFDIPAGTIRGWRKGADKIRIQGGVAFKKVCEAETERKRAEKETIRDDKKAER